MQEKMIIVSACLAGINCRYDGKSKPEKNVVEFSKKEKLFRFCPEQLEDVKFLVEIVRTVPVDFIIMPPLAAFQFSVPHYLVEQFAVPS